MDTVAFLIHTEETCNRDPAIRTFHVRIGRSIAPVALGTVFVSGAWAKPAAADSAPPDATIAFPAIQDEVYGRTPLTFKGTATDDTGVASVGVAFQERHSRLWYRPDGTWGAYFRFTARLSTPPGARSTTWSYTWTPPSAGAYLLQVVAKDTAGHPDAVLPFRRFDVDTVTPHTTIRTPSAATVSTRKGRTVGFAGNATDDHGVRSLQVAIQNRGTGKWLGTGGTWGAVHWFTKPVDLPGATSTTWSYALTMSWTGTFLVEFRAVDRAGLADPAPPSRQIIVGS
jgi:hypothetical protein